MRGVDKVRKVEKGVRFVVLRGKWLYIFVFFSSFLFHTGIQLLVKKCHLDNCTSFIHLYKRCLSFIHRLKGILICFNILRSTLCGSFVNFGVMKLYGDTALDDALNVFIKLLISLPLKNLLVREWLNIILTVHTMYIPYVLIYI